VNDVFDVVPPGSGASWVLGALTLLMLALAGMFIAMTVSTRTSRVELGADGLRVRSAFYGRVIPWTEIDAAGARAVDLTQEPSLRPRWRSNGIGLPGYAAGWFRLGEGRKGLLFVTDRHHVAAIPTRDYTLLVSVADAPALVEAVRQRGGGRNP
jgi:hypothetical protein